VEVIRQLKVMLEQVAAVPDLLVLVRGDLQLLVEQVEMDYLII
jgi:hypothetical protein